MSKKKKVRRVRKAVPKKIEPLAIDADEEQASASAKPAKRLSKRARARKKIKYGNTAPTEAELREEYAYVLKDLRRVFILAAGMFALLIILNLIFRTL